MCHNICRHREPQLSRLQHRQLRRQLLRTTMMVLMIIRLINRKRVKKKLLRLRRILQRKTSQLRIKCKT